MLKFILLGLSLIYILGGCEMTGAVSNVSNENENGKIEETVKAHALKNFTIPESKILVKEVKLNDLPAGVKQFLVSGKDASHGEQYTYLFRENQLYCSGVDEDFGRFLKDFDFLQKKDLDAAWLQTILWKLKNFQNMLVINDERIKNPREELKPLLNQITAPILSRTNDGGAVFKFFTQTPAVRPIQKFEITVAPNYQVKFQRQFVTA